MAWNIDRQQQMILGYCTSPEELKEIRYLSEEIEPVLNEILLSILKNENYGTVDPAKLIIDELKKLRKVKKFSKITEEAHKENLTDEEICDYNSLVLKKQKL
jgi:hypothetical protein